MLITINISAQEKQDGLLTAIEKAVKRHNLVFDEIALYPDLGGVYFFKNGFGCKVQLPSEAEMFAIDHMNGKRTKSCSFQLDIPQWIINGEFICM